MGTDWSAKLIVGEKIKRKMITTSITKYNEDTGKAYETDIDVPQWFIGKSDLLLSDVNEKIDVDVNDTWLHFPYYDAAIGVYGIKVAESESNRTYSEATSLIMEDISEAAAKYMALTGRIPEIFIDLAAD